MRSFACAMAPLERGQNTDHSKHAARDIDDGGAGAQRLSRRPCHVGEPSHHLSHLVQRDTLLVRSGQEPLRGTINEARIVRTQGVVTEPQTLERAGTEVLDHDVRRAREAAGQIDSGGVLQIEANAPLVAVVHRKIAGARTLERARAVAADRLHAGHLRAQVGQDQPRRGAHDHVGEFQHFHAGER